MTSRLTTCKTCGKSVSTSALTCPHCGELNPSQEDVNPTRAIERVAAAKPRKENIAGVLGATIFGLLAIVAIFFSPSKEVAPKNKVPQQVKTAPTVASGQNVIADAYMVCMVMNASGYVTECDVKGGDAAVDATIDTDSTEARRICVFIAGVMEAKKSAFAGRWKLRIFSPYSGSRPIAVCTLR